MGDTEKPVLGERHLGPEAGKEKASIFDNEDERLRGPELPGDKSSNQERVVHSRDPRVDQTDPDQPEEKASILSANAQKEESK